MFKNIQGRIEFLIPGRAWWEHKFSSFFLSFSFIFSPFSFISCPHIGAQIPDGEDPALASKIMASSRNLRKVAVYPISVFFCFYFKDSFQTWYHLILKVNEQQTNGKIDTILTVRLWKRWGRPKFIQGESKKCNNYEGANKRNYIKSNLCKRLF